VHPHSVEPPHPKEPDERGSSELHHIPGLPKDEYVRRAEYFQHKSHYESLTTDRLNTLRTREATMAATKVRTFANLCAKLIVELRAAPNPWEWPELLMRIEYWSNLAAEVAYLAKTELTKPGE
jgi:hypothetical protein